MSGSGREWSRRWGLVACIVRSRTCPRSLSSLLSSHGFCSCRRLVCLSAIPCCSLLFSDLLLYLLFSSLLLSSLSFLGFFCSLLSSLLVSSGLCSSCLVSCCLFSSRRVSPLLLSSRLSSSRLASSLFVFGRLCSSPLFRSRLLFGARAPAPRALGPPLAGNIKHQGRGGGIPLFPDSGLTARTSLQGSQPWAGGEGKFCVTCLSFGLDPRLGGDLQTREALYRARSPVHEPRECSLSLAPLPPPQSWPALGK